MKVLQFCCKEARKGLKFCAGGSELLFAIDIAYPITCLIGSNQKYSFLLFQI